MKGRFFLSLVFGLLAYVLVVIVGIICGVDLEIVFSKSVFAFIIMAIGSFFLLYFLENISLKEIEEEIENGNENENENEEEVPISEEEETEQEKGEELFSPLEIPVVEVEDAQ